MAEDFSDLAGRDLVVLLPRELVVQFFSVIDKAGVAAVLARAEKLDRFDRYSYAQLIEVAQESGKAP